MTKRDIFIHEIDWKAIRGDFKHVNFSDKFERESNHLNSLPKEQALIM